MRALFERQAQELLDHGARRDGRIGPEPPWPSTGDDPQTLLAAIVQAYAHAIESLPAGGRRALLDRQMREIEAQVAGA